tara:strand:+ start:205 stop:1401 length:1197 start_codon:yes stop_codon:yes gene_type:complete
MVNKNKTIVDLGGSDIRVGVYNNKLTKKLNFFEKNICDQDDLRKFNYSEKTSSEINNFIKKIESDLGHHIKSVNIMADIDEILSIDLSIKKKFEGNKLSKQDVKFLINEAKNLINHNYTNQSIIHFIISKILINNKIYESQKIHDIKCDSLIIEIKFLLIPIFFLEKFKSIFKKNDILINKFFYSSFVKSYNYKENFKNYNKKFFLDIGYKKTCLLIFGENNLIKILNIPLGGFHITNDLSKVLKINFDEAESVKKKLNLSNLTFSDKNDEILYSESKPNFEINDKISLDLVKKIIYARIDEIITLCFKNIYLKEIINESDNSILIFTGNGSKILDKKSIYLKEEFDCFDEINLFEETSETICNSGFKFDNFENDFSTMPKNSIKNKGFFERMFNLFN